MTDYRHWYKADLEAVHIQEADEKTIFALQAIKPSRI